MALYQVLMNKRHWTSPKRFCGREEKWNFLQFSSQAAHGEIPLSYDPPVNLFYGADKMESTISYQQYFCTIQQHFLWYQTPCWVSKPCRQCLIDGCIERIILVLLNSTRDQLMSEGVTTNGRLLVPPLRSQIVKNLE